MVTGGGSTPLQYDGQGHLIKKGNQSFTFDRSDLLLGVPGVASYRYDADGRRTVIDSNGVSRTAIYDHDGRLLMQLDPPLPVGCNAANDRVFCNSFEKAVQSDSVTRYTYLGRHLLARDDPQGRRYLHTDALGSLVAETDANGTEAQRYHYMPYGAAFGTMPNGPGYTGAVMDPSGLVYLQARYYDPQLGRFLSTDPVDPDPMSGTNFNRYAYANGNPYWFVDPSGRWVCNSSDDDCDAFEAGLDVIKDASMSPSLSDDETDTLQSVVDFYGEKGADSVSVSVSHNSGASGTENYRPGGGESISVRLTTPLEAFARNIVHEGQHGSRPRKGKGNRLSYGA